MLRRTLSTPNTIWVQEPLKDRYEEMTPEHFAANHGFTWQEDVSGGDTLPEGLTTETSPELDVAIADIEKYRDYLGIKYMSDTLGYGLFARKTIPQAVYICSYGGEFTFLKPEDLSTSLSNAYSTITTDPEENVNGIICAEKKRNMGGFIQHAPKYSQDYFYDSASSLIFSAYENVLACQFFDHGLPVAAFWTKTEIPANCVIVTSYGLNYWLNFGKVPARITWRGEIINPETYAANRIILRVNIPLENKQTSVDIETSVTDLENYFKEKDYLIIKANEDGENERFLVLNKEDIRSQREKCPQAPYVILQQPSLIITADQLGDFLSGKITPTTATNKASSAKENPNIEEKVKFFIKEGPASFDSELESKGSPKVKINSEASSEKEATLGGCFASFFSEFKKSSKEENKIPHYSRRYL